MRRLPISRIGRQLVERGERGKQKNWCVEVFVNTLRTQSPVPSGGCSACSLFMLSRICVLVGWIEIFQLNSIEFRIWISDANCIMKCAFSCWKRETEKSTALNPIDCIQPMESSDSPILIWLLFKTNARFPSLGNLNHRHIQLNNGP